MSHSQAAAPAGTREGESNWTIGSWERDMGRWQQCYTGQEMSHAVTLNTQHNVTHGRSVRILQDRITQGSPLDEVK